MTTDDLLAWGESWMYPRVVLYRTERECLRQGKDHWFTFLAQDNRKGLIQLQARINQWERRAAVVPSAPVWCVQETRL